MSKLPASHHDSQYSTICPRLRDTIEVSSFLDIQHRIWWLYQSPSLHYPSMSLSQNPRGKKTRKALLKDQHSSQFSRGCHPSQTKSLRTCLSLKRLRMFLVTQLGSVSPEIDRRFLRSPTRGIAHRSHQSERFRTALFILGDRRHHRFIL